MPSCMGIWCDLACFFEIPASTRLPLSMSRLSPPTGHHLSHSTVPLLPPSLSFRCISSSTGLGLSTFLFLPVLFTFHVPSTCRYVRGVLIYLALLITLIARQLSDTSSHGSIDMAGEGWITIPLLILPSRYQKGLMLIYRPLLLLPWTLMQEKMKVFLVLVSSCTDVAYS